ncbi:inositol monophosphatase family protein [Terasakiella sp. A23]|uniref:inositol monophosphatase family protein n=1 Tax=Terasakiella sp. FCG-A23 TaxID=3080561 RepID=UPI0029549969|nr:inositol monophosphatase family protein [Terasakiella sp. A23]MDV7339307.1 inositol monophosphatase family protein [Terasakiella sp. A23]
MALAAGFTFIHAKLVVRNFIEAVSKHNMTILRNLNVEIDIQDIIIIAKNAGKKILMPNWGYVIREAKSDGSPVTVVDQQASTFIIKALNDLTPDIPVISEEASLAQNEKALENPMHWVVDPLDGTATYLNGPKLGNTAGFGIHIALVKSGHPELGVCYFPAQEKCYYTGNDGKAYSQFKQESPLELSVLTKVQGTKLRAAVPWKIHKRPHDINGHSYEAVPAVGGEELCRVACGDAEIVWHNRPDKNESIAEREVFSHWDIAAAHAVLKAAGGNLFEIETGEVVAYNNMNFSVPSCVGGHPKLLETIGFYPAKNREPH